MRRRKQSRPRRYLPKGRHLHYWSVPAMPLQWEPSSPSQRCTPSNKDSYADTQYPNLADKDETVTSEAQTRISTLQTGSFASGCLCHSPFQQVLERKMPFLVKGPVVRPKHVIPTKCSCSSIGSLRRHVNKHQASRRHIGQRFARCLFCRSRLGPSILSSMR